MSNNNSTNCSAGPAPNPDVSGIGVRLSFYIQAVLLAILSARTSSADEITQNLGTLIVTNMAYAVTTLVLGFTNQANQLNLYDALVVLYLLTPSWTAIFFTMPQYNRHRKSGAIVKYLAILQSYLVFACAFAILTKAESFGSDPQCNKDLVFVIFRPFRVLYAGRNAFLVLLSLCTLFYTVMLYSDYSTIIHRYFREGEYKRTPRNILVALHLAKPLEKKNGDAEMQDVSGQESSKNNTAENKTGRDKHDRRKHDGSSRRRSSGVSGMPDGIRGSSSTVPASASPFGPSDNQQQQPPQQGADGIRMSPIPPTSLYPTTQDYDRFVAFTMLSPSAADFSPRSSGIHTPEDPFAAGISSVFGDQLKLPKQDMFDTRYRANVNGRLIVSLVLIIVTSSLAILNTELLRYYNNPQSDSGSSEGSWGFGQILPLFLTVLPAWSTILAFKKHGLGEKKKEGRKVRVKTARQRPQNRRPSSPRVGTDLFGSSSLHRNDPFLAGGSVANIFGHPVSPGPFSPGAHTNYDGTRTKYRSGATIEEVEDQEGEGQGSNTRSSGGGEEARSVWVSRQITEGSTL
ncbi:hypothetical protein NEOLEDRAFT_1093604 [Neolentinus lepideus HHB14362 ss-1]|uniref:Uncharacterized protein n=1 Tax=Neolentinus lepideus HHB14362 ss-1 TaxID=1314782 RepID=A0A165S7W8_9AGAM|nr:hypothetical protein NEOLEDRAFT_1093604 [Neolentinus lepideus HHB14362 ss-1]